MGQNVIWQDDPASIHRTADALAACQIFGRRVPHDKMAAKMSDVWVIGQYLLLMENKTNFYRVELYCVKVRDKEWERKGHWKG